MNGILTGGFFILLGGALALWTWSGARRTNTPFVAKDLFGGYNGVVGLGMVVVGLLMLVVSALAVVLS